MDVITTQDQAVATETPRRRSRNREDKSLDRVKKLLITSSGLKGEKKKNETKKLKKKLVEVEEQNESLTNAISEKNAEIAELRKSVNSLNDVLNSVPLDELRCNSSIASTKLLELSKKNRQLRAELETSKNRSNKKDIQIQKLEKELKMFQEKIRSETDLNKKNSSNSSMEELQTKCSALQQKLFETRNKNVELHSQLKLAQKCLQQEIGENFNLNILASHPHITNWRGRAQQIIHLQQKVQELKERLEAYEQQHLPQRHTLKFPSDSQSHDAATYEAHDSGMRITAAPSLISTFSVGSFERPAVRKSELQHRAKVESLEKEINNLKNQLEEHRGKILALKVRNKTLNDEISRYKMKANTLEVETDYNCLNVANMNEQLNQQKKKYEKRIEELSREISAILKQREEAELRESNMSLQLDNHKLTLNSKDEHIAELRTLIKKLECDLKAVCGGFLFSCRELRKEEFIAILDTLEAEKNALVQHNQTLGERIEQERHKNENLQELMAKQKTRITRLEAKIRELEKEMDSHNDRRKRTQRISEYANSLSGINSTTSIASLTFDNTSQLGINKNHRDFTENDIEDLKNRLELANEKVTMLKEKLDYITAEKENDIKTFEQIINNTKTIILDTILAQKANDEETSALDNNSVAETNTID